MSNIRKHMAASLVPGRAVAAHERERVAADRQAQTTKTLRAFKHDRMKMAKTLKFELASDHASRSAEVLGILGNAKEMSNGFRLDHDLMSANLRQSLVESREAVASSVASLFVDFSKDRVAFSKAHRRMAKAQGAGLAKDRRERSQAVSELIRSFTKAHHLMAKVQWAYLANCRRERSDSLAELMQAFHGSRGHTVRSVAETIVPLPVAPRLVLKPAAPIAAPKREPVKPLPKVAQSFAKPWPSAPPRGEPVKPVAKKAQTKVKVKVKATPAKTVRPKAKALKPKKK